MIDLLQVVIKDAMQVKTSKSSKKHNSVNIYQLEARSYSGEIVLQKEIALPNPAVIETKESNMQLRHQRKYARFLLAQWFYTHVIYFDQMEPSLKKWWIGRKKTPFVIDGWIIVNYRGKHYLKYGGEKYGGTSKESLQDKVAAAIEEAKPQILGDEGVFDKKKK